MRPDSGWRGDVESESLCMEFEVRWGRFRGDRIPLVDRLDLAFAQRRRSLQAFDRSVMDPSGSVGASSAILGDTLRTSDP